MLRLTMLSHNSTQCSTEPHFNILLTVRIEQQRGIHIHNRYGHQVGTVHQNFSNFGVHKEGTSTYPNSIKQYGYYTDIRNERMGLV